MYGMNPVDGIDRIMSWQILYQRAAEEHVNDLQSPTDAKNRPPMTNKIIQ